MGSDLKRWICLVVLLSLFLCLTACTTEGTSTVEETATETASVTEQSAETDETAAATDASAEPETEPEVVIASDARLFDASTMTEEELDAQIVAQDNRQGLASFVWDNLWVYGVQGGSSGAGEVVKARHDLSDWTVLDSYTGYALAKCKAVKDGYLYYCQYASDDADYFELVKVRVSGKDGTVIIPETAGYIQFVGDYIYYTSPEHWNEDYTAVLDDSAHLYRCDLNGENVEPILEKPVYYFSVFADTILYQDDHDGCSLHLYNMTTGEDEKLNDVGSYWPIYDGEYIYYLSDHKEPGSYSYTLCRMTPDGSMNEEIELDCHLASLSLRGDYLYFVNTDDDNRIYRCWKDGSGYELITQDANVQEFQWVNNSIVYLRLDNEGYIDGIYVCNADGSGKYAF